MVLKMLKSYEMFAEWLNVYMFFHYMFCLTNPFFGQTDQRQHEGLNVLSISIIFWLFQLNFL